MIHLNTHQYLPQSIYIGVYFYFKCVLSSSGWAPSMFEKLWRGQKDRIQASSSHQTLEGAWDNEVKERGKEWREDRIGGKVLLTRRHMLVSGATLSFQQISPFRAIYSRDLSEWFAIIRPRFLCCVYKLITSACIVHFGAIYAQIITKPATSPSSLCHN